MPNGIGVGADGIAGVLREAGIAGAGGAGFPSYAKWTDPGEARYFLMNHQESEPDFYSDKWLVHERPEEFAAVFEFLLDEVVDLVVVGTKIGYRDRWLGPLETATDATVYGPDELPLDPDDESGIVVAYTPDDYDNSEEPVLLMTTTDTMLMGDLPTEHGWIVHNTETVHNVRRALEDGAPVTRKYVVVDGDTPTHRLLDVPIGTTAARLLEEAGLDGLDAGQIMLDGGPGWCTTVDVGPAEFGVRKRTNAVLVVDEALAEANRDEWEEIRVNLLDAREWRDREHETEPTRIEPDRVHVPLMTNEAHEGVVAPSDPAVEVGDAVAVGDVVATAVKGEISIPQHASIPGTVSDVTESHVTIER